MVFLSLAEIFGEPKAKKAKKRGSSENWNRDGLTAKEEAQYKKKMGFVN